MPVSRSTLDRCGSRTSASWALPTTVPSAYADGLRTAVGTDDDGGVVSELASVAEEKRALTRREEVAVRRARNVGLTWEEIGTLLGVTRQTIHRKYRKVG